METKEFATAVFTLSEMSCLMSTFTRVLFGVDDLFIESKIIQLRMNLSLTRFAVGAAEVAIIIDGRRLYSEPDEEFGRVERVCDNSVQLLPK